MRASRRVERAIEPLARSTRRRSAAPTPCPPGRDSAWHLCDSYKNIKLMPKAAHLPTGLSFQSALFLFFFSTFHLDIYTRSVGSRAAPGPGWCQHYITVCTTTSLNSSTPAPACARTHAGLCPRRRLCRTPRTSPRSRRRRTRYPASASRSSFLSSKPLSLRSYKTKMLLISAFCASDSLLGSGGFSTLGGTPTASCRGSQAGRLCGSTPGAPRGAWNFRRQFFVFRVREKSGHVVRERTSARNREAGGETGTRSAARTLKYSSNPIFLLPSLSMALKKSSAASSRLLRFSALRSSAASISPLRSTSASSKIPSTRRHLSCYTSSPSSSARSWTSRRAGAPARSRSPPARDVRAPACVPRGVRQADQESHRH